MVHQERLEIGEKCFVSSIMAVLALEAALTVITCGMHFSWTGLLLGVFGFCLILFLANQLYAGSRQAHRIALTWIGFQVLYAAFVLYLIASSSAGAELAKRFGAPAAWPVVLKVLAYLSLGWVLVRMPTVRDFFADKRGEVRTHDLLAQKAAVAPQPTTPLELTAAQAENVNGLSHYLRLTVGALIALGVMLLLMGVFVIGLLNPPGLLTVIQGVFMVVLGIALGAPSNEIQPLTTPEDRTKDQLLEALESFGKFYKLQAIIGVLLIAVAIARLVIMLR